MALVELDLNLTDEQKAMRDLVRRFGEEVARPASIALDKLPDPQDVIGEDSILWDVYRAWRKLGLHRTGLPEAVGGTPVDVVTGYLIGEEMGYWADDLAISLSVSNNPFGVCLLSPDPEVRRWALLYAEDTEIKMIGCWAITEPDHGSDTIFFDGPQSKNPRMAFSLRAAKKGDRYVLNGQKSAWVSNGTIATHAVVHVGLPPEQGQGMAASGVAVLPLNLPGISKGKPLNKMGQRALNQGEIFFDDVEIPDSMMIVKDAGTYRLWEEAIVAGANGGMGPVYAGLAAAALGEALAYAKTRVQGGVPIAEHQNVKLKLFEMFKQVEAARSLARRVALYNKTMQPPATHYSIATKVLSTETAFRVASEAIQIFGGYGLTKDYHIEKIFRDAKTAMIEDGENNALSLGGADRLIQ